MTRETSIGNAAGRSESAGVGANRGSWLSGAVGPARLHLAALDAVLVRKAAEGDEVDRPHGLACGLVARQDAPPVLNVVRVGDPGRSLNVGCERVAGRWWYVVAATGEGIVPVEDVQDAPAVLVSILGREEG